ncbi:zinc-binding dehydrogenase [Streptomyces laurentii]|uniref:zinc-binding dehydrogenase n=1 Tax=Streptomyces laurentii TaxID=39478 RepID=UPI0033D5A6BE
MLVVGATGGVGTALIPLLAAARAHVIATATDGDAEVLRALGADETIGYRASDDPADVDVVVNAVLPGDRLSVLARALRPGGRLLTVTHPVPTTEMVGRDGIELHFVIGLDVVLGDMRDMRGMRDIGEAAERGELRATIGRRYRLDEGPRACVDFCLSVWLVAGRDIGRPVLSLIRNAATRRVAARQLS